jgi:prepilin-type N-terminal cleavage/methylation domain-containing protein
MWAATQRLTKDLAHWFERLLIPLPQRDGVGPTSMTSYLRIPGGIPINMPFRAMRGNPLPCTPSGQMPSAAVRVMPRILGSFRPRRDLPGGFTLLELLVVLVLLAGLVGLIAPAGSRAVEAARERARVQELKALIERLPLEAAREGRVILVDGPSLLRRLSEWPQGSPIETNAPLGYSPEGVATGGALSWQSPSGQVTRWEVEAGTGRLLVSAP